MALSRREFLAYAGTTAAVCGFDPVTRTWMTSANAHDRYPCLSSISIPNLDGELTVDPESLAEAADDFGHIVSQTPLAVLKSGNENDIRRVIKFCKRNRIKVAMRGQGHAVLGEAQVDCGIVIDSRTLSTIHSIDANGAVVDAGVTWRENVDRHTKERVEAQLSV